MAVTELPSAGMTTTLTPSRAGVDSSYVLPENIREIREAVERLSPFSQFIRNSKVGMDRKTTQKEVRYWQRGPNTRQGAIEAVTMNGSTYTSGAVQGSVLKFTTNEADALSSVETNMLLVWSATTDQWRAVHVENIESADNDPDTGAGRSIITVKCLEADPAYGGVYTFAQTDLVYMRAIGAQSEVRGLPNGTTRWPSPYTNIINNLSCAFKVSEAEWKQRAEADPQLEERLMTEIMGDLTHGRTSNILFSRYWATHYDVDGNQIPHQRGFLQALAAEYPTHIIDLRKDTTYITANAAFTSYWLSFVNKLGEEASRYASADSKLVITSGYALGCIQDAIRAATGYTFVMEPDTSTYGFEVKRLNIPGGIPWDFVQDGAWDKFPMLRKTALILEPGVIEPVHRLETRWIPDDFTDDRGKDHRTYVHKGYEEEFCTIYDKLYNVYLLKGMGEANNTSH